jgi:aspartyl protease family protein
VKILLRACAAIALAGGPSLVAAAELTKCVAGQEVTDEEGKTGIIVVDDDKLCQVKYADGQIYRWIFWNLRPAAARANPGSVMPQTAALGPSNRSPTAPTVLRPSSNQSLVYRADRRGHFILTAAINGAPIRVVVDTGASLVALSLDDAQAAGINRNEMRFDRITRTANGATRFALVTLRQIQNGQLSVDNVPAAVIESLDQSLLGMSFLTRLKSFEIRQGALTFNW